jgi:GNAT superfamily N-acetyltransferase
MAPEMRLVAVSDGSGAVTEMEWLVRAEAVHRQLRPQLPQDYVGRLTEVFANGARMAVVVDGAAVLCVALWRVIENTSDGRRLFVDDLVSDEVQRSQGAGKMMLDWLEQEAVALGCVALTLDSGVQRQRAHRFYFREGMHIASFCFRKALK